MLPVWWRFTDSFGVLLFEMICGRLPFPSTDPTELVHCHIAQRPPQPEFVSSLHDPPFMFRAIGVVWIVVRGDAESQLWTWPELPPLSPLARALSSIIMRLLAKNKEDRYQSAAGVKMDLEACLEALQSPTVVPLLDSRLAFGPSWQQSQKRH